MEFSTEIFVNRDWKYWRVPEVIEVEGNPTVFRRGGEGPTTVFLHGGGGTRAWTPFHAELAKKVDLIAPEHPGFGDSPKPDHFDRWEDYILHYDAFFRALELDKVHLVGTSLGAWIAANLAVYFPERFASLTLITPVGVRVIDEPLFDVFRMSPEEGLERLLNGRAAQHEDQLVQEDAFEDGLHAFAEESTAALLMWNPRYDAKFDYRLNRIQAPTQVIAAEDDRTVGNEQAPRFAELIPDANLTTLAGPDGQPSSHGMLIDQPADVAHQIVTHINVHSGQSALVN